MSRIVLLDSGPLGLVSNPNLTTQADACNQWMEGLLANGVRVVLPELADYEVRRELLRASKTAGITRLDRLVATLEYLPLTTAAMRQAAAFWAQARQQGQPTAGDKTIDGDVILAAQAVTLGATDIVIATTNVGHIARFAPADIWHNITA